MLKNKISLENRIQIFESSKTNMKEKRTLQIKKQEWFENCKTIYIELQINIKMKKGNWKANINSIDAKLINNKKW